MMREIVRDLRAWRRDRGAMIARLGELTVLQQRVFLGLLRDRQPVGRVSEVVGMPISEVGVELVRGLRRVSATPGTGEHDEQIAQWLLSTDAVTSKDAVQRRIEEDGATPEEIHALEAAFTALRSAPARAWSAATASPVSTLPDPPWPVDPQTLNLLDSAVRGEVPRQMVAASHRLTERELDRRLVGGLRSLAGLPARAALDRMIAGFLLDGPDGPPSRQLWAAGVDPIELHELELVVVAIRAMPDSSWQVVHSYDHHDGRFASNGDGRLARNGAGRLARNGDGHLATDGDGRVVSNGNGNGLGAPAAETVAATAISEVPGP